jgi:mannose/cellobiose epimerase-like protein (N-acyl-D-glucosamine 2-epimerase family)
MDREAEGRRLLAFARRSALPGLGFGWLDDQGAMDPAEPVQTWITARMTHVFALAALRGDPEAAGLADLGVQALTSGPLRDPEHPGWLGAVARSGAPVAERKLAYDHAFVALAASSAQAAGVPGAGVLLGDAVAVLERYFLDDVGRVVDGYPRDLTAPEGYRGANSSMHTVEATLALGDVLDEPRWHRIALGIAEHLVHQVAAGRGHRLPEHFDERWTPLPEYNADRPGDQFRPYGVTPGHLLEWARLLLQVEASLEAGPAWLLEDARALFDRAVEIGWDVDGAPGFVYTTDWQDRPVVRDRMHWVLAEAIGAAAALARRTGERRYADLERDWWDFVDRYFVDHLPGAGSWFHELDPDNRPVAGVWSGKPDVYHAYQATLLTRLPTAPSLAAQLARRG